MCKTHLSILHTEVGGAYWWPCIVKGTHRNFEASSLPDQDVLLWYPHILEGNASGVRTSLAHVKLLQEKCNFLFNENDHIQLTTVKNQQALWYLSSNLNSRSVGIQNKASKGFAGWTFRIRVSPSQEEVPTHRKGIQL